MKGLKNQIKIPLDTLGHPLPPPVASNAICRIPSRDWGKWWEKYHCNALPKDKDCCVCGCWFEAKLLTALDTELVNPRVQRQYLNGMMAKNIFLCQGCRKKCFSCNRFIPDAQKTLFNNHCQKCYILSGAKKSITKRPSRR